MHGCENCTTLSMKMKDYGNLCISTSLKLLKFCALKCKDYCYENMYWVVCTVDKTLSTYTMSHSYTVTIKMACLVLVSWVSLIDVAASLSANANTSEKVNPFAPFLL